MAVNKDFSGLPCYTNSKEPMWAGMACIGLSYKWQAGQALYGIMASGSVWLMIGNTVVYRQCIKL